MTPKIDRFNRKQGVLSRLDVQIGKNRRRKNLGYNLTPEQEQQRLAEELSKLLQQSTAPVPDGQDLTLEQFVPTYWDAFATRGGIHVRIPESHLRLHILSKFGSRPLSSLRAEDGLRFLRERKEEGAQTSTINREWRTFMAVLNLAVDFDRLDKNRLKKVPRAIDEGRDRLPAKEEFAAIRDRGGNFDVWRAVIAGSLIGLREAKIVLAKTSQISHDKDGFWFRPEKAVSSKKRVPDRVPLSRLAYEALTTGAKDGKCFPWNSQMAFQQCYARVFKKAGIENLHYHDLRHWFSSTLDGFVHPNTRKRLTGHALDEMTERYVHMTPEIAKQCREAVTKLEQHWKDEIGLTLTETPRLYVVGGN